jgi:Protein of unknown function (DUF3574)
MTATFAVIASKAKQSRAIALLLVVFLAGCAPQTPGAPHACLLPSEQRMLVAELFFGRNILGRGPLTEAEWAAFARDIITPNFPAGFTVFDGEGQWRNPANGAIAREPTKILLVAARRSPDLPYRLAAVMDAYKAHFHQQSVGLISRDSCAAF